MFMNGLQVPFLPIDAIKQNGVLATTIRGLGAGLGVGGAGLVTLGTFGAVGTTLATLGGVGALPLGVMAFTMSNSLWRWGVGKMMGRDIIHLCGLWHRGAPMVAGMEGAYKDNVTTHMWDDIRTLFDFNAKIQGALNV